MFSRNTLFLIACALAVAAAFVQTGVPLRAPTAPVVERAVAPNMMVEVDAVNAATNLVAANAGDFGGYTIPVIGLGLLGAIIGILAGPGGPARGAFGAAPTAGAAVKGMRVVRA